MRNQLFIKLSLTFIFSIFASVLFAQTNTGQAWKTLSKDNFSLQYPGNWELNQEGQMNTTFIIFSPLETEKDQFKENVNLIIEDLKGKSIDLKKYTEMSEEQIKTMITNSKITENSTQTVNGQTLQKLVYTGDMGIYHLKFVQYYIIKNEKAYVLTFTAEQDKYNSYIASGNKILNSFKLK